MKKFVYSFNEGSKDMRDLLGGKGANLAEMTKIGLPVPFGFTVTTEACTRYYEEGETIGTMPQDPFVAGKIFEDLMEKFRGMTQQITDRLTEILQRTEKKEWIPIFLRRKDTTTSS